MSLNQDASSIEDVLNSVGCSILHISSRQQRRPRPQNDVKSGEEKSNDSWGSLDVGLRLAQGSASDFEAFSKETGFLHGRPKLNQEDITMHGDFTTKRKRVDMPIIEEEQNVTYVRRGQRDQKPSSRDLMPPPPIPMHQPYVYVIHDVPQPNLHETSSQHGEARASQPETTVSEDIMPYQGKLTRQVQAVQGPMRLVPTMDANNDCNPPPHSLNVRAPDILTYAGPSPGFAGLQRYTLLDQEGSPYSSSLSVSSSRNSRRCRIQGSEEGSLQSRPEMDSIGHGAAPAPHGFGSATTLGLSSKSCSSRSSSSSSRRQSSQSPADHIPHRRRLGEEPSASPHFSSPRPFSGTFRSNFGNPSSFHGRRVGSWASDATTLVGSAGPNSVHDDRTPFIAGGVHAESGRGRSTAAGDLKNPVDYQTLLSRARLPTTDLEASRRRARR